MHECTSICMGTRAVNNNYSCSKGNDISPKAQLMQIRIKLREIQQDKSRQPEIYEILEFRRRGFMQDILDSKTLVLVYGHKCEYDIIFWMTAQTGQTKIIA